MILVQASRFKAKARAKWTVITEAKTEKDKAVVVTRANVGAKAVAHEIEKTQGYEVDAGGW